MIANGTEVQVSAIVRQHAKDTGFQSEAYWVSINPLDASRSPKYVWVRADTTTEVKREYGVRRVADNEIIMTDTEEAVDKWLGWVLEFEGQEARDEVLKISRVVSEWT